MYYTTTTESKTTAHPSACTTSEQKLGDLIRHVNEVNKDSSLPKIFISNKLMELADLKRQLDDCAFSNMDTLRDTYKLHSTKDFSGQCTKLNEVLGLLTKSEIAFQKSTELKEAFYGSEVFQVNDNSSGSQGYVYGCDENKGVQTHLYSLNNKPDGVSRKHPMMVEWKVNKSGINYDLIWQSLNRLLAISAVHGIIRQAVCFAVDSSDVAWMFVLSVDITLEKFNDDNYVRIDIIKVKREHFPILWLLFTQKEEREDTWYIDDAVAIIQYLNERKTTFRVPWCYCMIRLVALSSSRVYQITLPSQDKPLTICDNGGSSFMLKVNSDIERFEKEACVIMTMLKKYSKDEYYAMEPFKFDGNVKGEECGNGFNLGSLSLEDGNHCFVAFCPTNTTAEKRGIIEMKVGEPIVTFTCQILSELFSSISRLHEAGFYHCDIRRCNYLYFPELKRAELIDFDLAVPISKPESCIVRGSGRYKRSPWAVRKLFKDSIMITERNIRWTAEYDYAMVTEYVIHAVLRDKRCWNGSIFEDEQ